MDILSSKFSTIVKGIITGFDRIVFKGMLRPVIHSKGMENFLISQGVLNKDFKEYAMKQSQEIVRSAEEMAKRLNLGEIDYLSSIHMRKEALAHARQKEKDIKEGLIGIWACVESCNTFRSTYDPVKKYPSLRNEKSRCKHLYFYFDDPVYGFMSARLQTWLPYEIQIALNGREWLSRSLDASGCGYVLSGNKFLHIDDYGLAQSLLDAQLELHYEEILNGFLPAVFPAMQQAAGGMSYYWTLWQSEMAKDYIFDGGDALKPLMKDFLRHALITGGGERILHYFGSPVKPGGQPHPNSNPEILSRANTWYDGLRVRHWNGGNSVKLYNEHNVLRFEMTMNDPAKFKVYRHAENQNKAEPKKFMPMRKGVADVNARAGVSLNVINRFTDQMAAVEEKTRLGELLMPLAEPITAKGKRPRALDAFGKDRELLQAVSDPAFNAGGITNKELQKKLKDTLWAKKKSGKQLSGRISRHLVLLREHGMIKKLPKQRKYMLTEKGRKITAALNAALAASVNDLLKIAA
jgi:hypothetical protein